MLSPLAILKHSSKLSGANLLNAILGLFVGIVVARVLGPELLGVVGFLTLWSFYAGLLRPGVFSAAYREMPYLISQGDKDRLLRIQNLGITVEALYLMVAVVVIMAVGLVQDNQMLRIGFILVSLSFGMALLRDFVAGVQWAHQRFGLIARVNFVSALSRAAFVLSVVWVLGVYGVLMAPMVVALAGLVMYRIWAPSLGFSPRWDRAEAWRLLKIGIPLSLGTIFYWVFRTVDRTAVALWLPLTDMGYFTFVFRFVNLALLVVSDFGNVMQPELYAQLGRAGGAHKLSRGITRITMLLLVVACAGVSLAQAGFGAFVHWFTPKFLPSIAVFEVFIFLLALFSMAIIPNLLMNSAVLNKQNLFTAVWGFALLPNAALAYIVIHSGWGLVGLAWGTVAAQTLVVSTLWVLIHRHLFNSGREAVAFFAPVAGVFLVVALVYGLFQVGPFVYGEGSNVLIVAITRLLLATIIWGIVGVVIYVWWLRRPGALSHIFRAEG
jgi:O-antigen/teichoic acid export membrane protein